MADVRSGLRHREGIPETRRLGHSAPVQLGVARPLWECVGCDEPKNTRATTELGELLGALQAAVVGEGHWRPSETRKTSCLEEFLSTPCPKAPLMLPPPKPVSP